MSNSVKNKLINSILLFLIPIVICSVNAYISGGFIWNASLLVSDWNDELFYYKQVEAVLKHGIPLGFYGFNESSAAYFSFAAWSPVILLPWIVWGLLFGWNLFSPILCNIVIMSVALFAFAWLTNLKLKHVAVLYILFTMFMPISRYLFSSMPETNIVAFIIIVFGLFFYSEKAEKKASIYLEMILIFILTLARPYFAMLFLLPAKYMFQRKKSSLFYVAFVGIFSEICYFIISKLFTAPYFSSIFSMSWGKVFLTEGIPAGFANIREILAEKTDLLFSDYWKDLFITKNSTGTYFFFLIVFLLFWTVQLVYDAIRKEKNKVINDAIYILFHLAMLVSVMLMYKLVEGSRHFIWLIAVDLVLISCSLINEYYISNGVIAALIFILCVLGGNNHKLYCAPLVNDNNIENLAKYESIIAMNDVFYNTIDKSEELSWDNDIIWLFMDYEYADGEKVYSLVDYNYAYLLPSELAINCCDSEYVWSYINYLKSKYILVSATGETKNALIDNHAVYICGDDDISIYKIR